jgi:hypothetical protein
MLKKTEHGNWLQYVSPKSCLLQYVVQKKSSYGVVVSWLRTWFLNVEVRSSSPHTRNLGYLGYLGDLIKYPRLPRLQNLLDHLPLASPKWLDLA